MLRLDDVHVHIGKLHILQGVTLEVKPEDEVRIRAFVTRLWFDDMATLREPDGTASP